MERYSNLLLDMDGLGELCHLLRRYLIVSGVATLGNVDLDLLWSVDKLPYRLIKNMTLYIDSR
jgi:hypothetical protein